MGRASAESCLICNSKGASEHYDASRLPANKSSRKLEQLLVKIQLRPCERVLLSCSTLTARSSRPHHPRFRGRKQFHAWDLDLCRTFVKYLTPRTPSSTNDVIRNGLRHAVQCLQEILRHVNLQGISILSRLLLMASDKLPLDPATNTVGELLGQLARPIHKYPQ